MQQVVYNTCFGGFSINREVVEFVRDNRVELEEEYGWQAVDEIAEQTLGGEEYDGGGIARERGYVSAHDVSRDNELLADIVSGETAYRGRVSGDHASLSVAEVPDGIDWTIDEYDGKETVKEKTQSFS
jgi:hypothetical protein